MKRIPQQRGQILPGQTVRGGVILKPPPKPVERPVPAGSLPTSEVWRLQRTEAVAAMQSFVATMAAVLPFEIGLGQLKTPWGSTTCLPSPQGWMFAIAVRGQHREVCHLPYTPETWDATFHHWENMIRWWSDPDGEFLT